MMGSFMTFIGLTKKITYKYKLHIRVFGIKIFIILVNRRKQKLNFMSCMKLTKD